MTFTHNPMGRLQWAVGVLMVAVVLAAPPASDADAVVTCGGEVADITGDDGDNVLRGTAGNDVIAGLGGDDQIKGFGGDDIICGGAGNDTIFGRSGDDKLYGEGGRDLIDGGLGSDRINGGAGVDTVTYDEAKRRVSANLTTGTVWGGGGRDTLVRVERLIGSPYDDILVGNQDANRLEGAGGNDTLKGRGGNDQLIGGPNADIGSGGPGSDYCRTEDSTTCELGGLVTITSLPASDPDGTYTLHWECRFVCNTAIVIQEDSNTSFPSPSTTIYTSADAFSGSRQFSGKAAGTYCYRVSNGLSEWSAPACVNVTSSPPTPPTLRIVNNSHYGLIWVILNGQHQITSSPNMIPAGAWQEYTFGSPGTVEYGLRAGWWDSEGNRQEALPDGANATGTVSVQAGQTTTLTYNNPTVTQMLTQFSTFAEWSGDYWVGTTPHWATFRFYSSGRWNLCSDGNYLGSGNIYEHQWTDYSLYYYWKQTTTSNYATVTYPWVEFTLRNGPVDWPFIQYNYPKSVMAPACPYNSSIPEDAEIIGIAELPGE